MMRRPRSEPVTAKKTHKTAAILIREGNKNQEMTNAEFKTKTSLASLGQII